ncbi:MAG TPA: glycosyltransferase [Thermoleophilaceae bacterium]|nr:glycosyltransferase [Thermoleophilaceae bacterium]
MRASDQIGVAISTRDRPESLARCLQSLGAGPLLPAEVVVADQSSGPATRALVDRAARSATATRYVREPDGGLARAQNAAFRHGTSAIVAVIDDDCVADPRWIAMLERRFTADPGLALIGGRVLPGEAAGDHLAPVSSRPSGRRLELSGKSPPWRLGSGNNFAVRREWFERVGGCDVRLGPGTPGLGALDMDLFYRVLRAGGRGLYEPEAVVFHERATRAGRKARRWPYGHGLGAMCVFLLRERDGYALRLLAAWIGLRLRLLAAALVRGRWEAIREEALVLGGTLAGMAHGVTRGKR